MRSLTKGALTSVAAVCLCVSATTAFAQVDTGTILGTVKDGSGAVISGAKVTLTHEGQAFTLTRMSRPDGTYIFTPIRTGTYLLEVESAGFKKAVRRGIVLSLQQQAVVDVSLDAGQVAEEVDVTAEVPLLQTQSGEVGQTIATDTIEALPLNGRDYTALARLSAGTARPQQGARAALQFTANGTRPGREQLHARRHRQQHEQRGLPGRHRVRGEAAGGRHRGDQGARPARSGPNTAARAARCSSATLKSGSNEFHGSAWEFNRNDSLKAAEFFENARGLKKGTGTTRTSSASPPAAPS